MALRDAEKLLQDIEEAPHSQMEPLFIMFRLQERFQQFLGTDIWRLRDEDPERWAQWLRDMMTALTAELHEALDETGWKPWATSRHLNRDAFLAEMVDAWHFFMNLCMLGGVSPRDLFLGYLRKLEVNVERQLTPGGYTAVKDKCPRCHRAYGEPGVNCFRPPQGGTGVCAETGELVP